MAVEGDRKGMPLAEVELYGLRLFSKGDRLLKLVLRAHFLLLRSLASTTLLLLP